MFNYYIGFGSSIQKEGGASRNNAIFNELKGQKLKSFLIADKGKIYLIINCIILNLHLIFLKKNYVYINYNIISLIFFGRKLAYTQLGKIYIKLILKNFVKNNNVYFEVNDLQYEQTLDLGLAVNHHYHIDSIVFNLENCNFIFASCEMKKYIEKKYKLENSNFVLINGGNVHNANDLKSNNSYLKFVYAGSLNRGRGIEKMIDCFKGKNNKLIIMGEGGEWINNYVKGYYNISYLGALDEDTAKKYVSSCDCGLIPYDSNLFYYNICFPAKASFYITSGIPFLSTPTKELKNHFSENEVYYSDFDSWEYFISNNINSKDILTKKLQIDKIKNHFSWNSLVKKLLLDINSNQIL